MTAQLHIPSKQISVTYDVQLWRLLHAKKDVDHYMNALKNIYYSDEQNEIKEKAASYLSAQLDIKDTMNELIERVKHNRYNEDKKIALKLEKAIEKFDKDHFELKKNYFTFISKYYVPNHSPANRVTA